MVVRRKPRQRLLVTAVERGVRTNVDYILDAFVSTFVLPFWEDSDSPKTDKRSGTVIYSNDFNDVTTTTARVIMRPNTFSGTNTVTCFPSSNLTIGQDDSHQDHLLRTVAPSLPVPTISV